MVWRIKLRLIPSICTALILNLNKELIVFTKPSLSLSNVLQFTAAPNLIKKNVFHKQFYNC